MKGDITITQIIRQDDEYVGTLYLAVTKAQPKADYKATKKFHLIELYFGIHLEVVNQVIGLCKR